MSLRSSLESVLTPEATGELLMELWYPPMNKYTATETHP